MLRRITLTLLLFAAAACYGQSPQIRYATFLLDYPSLQRELGLSQGAIRKIAQINKDAQKWYLSKASPTPQSPNVVRQPTYKEMQEHTLKTETALVNVLSAPQRTRLREVGLQYAGGFGISEPAVAKTLKITSAQQAQLRDAGSNALKDYNKAVSEIPKVGHLEPGKIHSQSETSHKMVAARLALLKRLNADAAKILTPSQMSLWKRMQGKPFPVASLYAPVISKAR